MKFGNLLKKSKTIGEYLLLSRGDSMQDLKYLRQELVFSINFANFLIFKTFYYVKHLLTAASAFQLAQTISKKQLCPLDTGRKLNVHKTFTRGNIKSEGAMFLLLLFCIQKGRNIWWSRDLSYGLLKIALCFYLKWQKGKMKIELKSQKFFRTALFENAILYAYKQPLADVFHNRCSYKFRNIHRNTLVLEPLFN